MEVNGLTGMSSPEELSLLFSFLFFGMYVTAEAGALTLFYMASRPRHGRIRTAAGWHLSAAAMFMLSIIALGVWAAPAEKSFVDNLNYTRLFPFTPFDLGWRFDKVEISWVFLVIGAFFVLLGVARGGAQRRIWQRASVPAI